MKAEATKDLDRIFAEDGHLIAEAIKKGVRDAILHHKQAGFPIVVWRDGKSVWIPPEEIDDYLAAQDARR
jgi:hypothetical protein